MLDSNVLLYNFTSMYKSYKVLISVVFNKHFLLGSMKSSLSPYVYQVKENPKSSTIISSAGQF